MKINDLSNQLGVTNKELITFLKTNGFNEVKSHMQNATEPMISTAIAHFDNQIDTSDKTLNKSKPSTPKVKEEPITTPKKFMPDDMIPCRSVTPWELQILGTDRHTVYHWVNFGDIDYVKYSDLQAFRRKDLIRAPKIIIEDADLCYQWRRELGDTYKYFLGIEYPEEFFDLPDEEFEKKLKTAPNVVKEVIKVTALNMVKNKNYPTITKLTLVDEILGTCIKEFL